ncbi:MAG TPA: hypothetical protein VHQ43_05135 [Solirubrobacterales bacterium]|nr:hypothetical protein [Solirubrobacterales bacterium]
MSPRYRRRMQSVLVKLARIMSPAKGDSLSAVLDRAGSRRGGSVGFAFAVRALRAERQRGA